MYYDCPGFSDSRGPVKDIANAFAISKIFASAEKVQVMLVVEETSLIGSNRGQNFKELINRVSELFENNEDFVKNAVLVFTKVEKIKDFATRITKIINQNGEVEESLISHKQKLLLQGILANAKIVIFTSPNKAGPIDLYERQAILVASDNTLYAIKPKVNITVSTSSLLTLQKLTETVNKQIKSNVKKLGELLTTNLDKIPLSKLEEIKANINQLNVREFTNDDEIVEFIETRIANLVTTNSPDINKDKVTIALQEVKSLVGYFSQFFAKILPRAHVESDKLKGAFTFNTLNAFEKAINNEVLKNNQEKLKEVNATLDKNQKEFKAQLDKQAANFANAAKDNANRITALAEQLKSEKQQRVDLNKLFENSKIEVNSLRSTIDANQRNYKDQIDKQTVALISLSKASEVSNRKSRLIDNRFVSVLHQKCFNIINVYTNSGYTDHCGFVMDKVYKVFSEYEPISKNYINGNGELSDPYSHDPEGYYLMNSVAQNVHANNPTINPALMKFS